MVEDVYRYLAFSAQLSNKEGYSNMRALAFSNDPPKIADPYINQIDAFLGPGKRMVKHPP